jgi:hypothetical protein
MTPCRRRRPQGRASPALRRGAGSMVGTGAVGAPMRLFFQPHWPEPVVEDALKVADRASKQTFA